MGPNSSTLSIEGGLLGAASGAPKVPASLSGGTFNIKPSAPATAAPAVNYDIAGGAPSSFNALPSPYAPGLGGYAAAGAAAIPTVKPTPPVSTITKKPLNYGSTANPSLAHTTPVVNPDGSAAIVDAHGNNLSGNDFSIAATGPIASSYLNPGASNADVSNALALHQQYVQQLAAASGYSPEYLNAYQASQQAQQQQTNIRNNISNNPNAVSGTQGGETTDLVNTMGSRQLAQNSADQAAAGIALNTQQLARQGDIAAAQALVQATQPQSVSPGSSLVSPYNGSTTYGGQNALSDYQATMTAYDYAGRYPDANNGAGIKLDPSMSPQQMLSSAEQQAATSPSFASNNTVQVPLPGGGVSFVNKNQLLTDPKTGQAVIISSSDATAASAASSAVKDLTSQQANVQRAIDTAESNYPLLLSTVKQAGINNYDSPLANQLANKLKGNLTSQMAPFNALVTSLQTEYSQIIARGGSVTDTTRKEAGALVDNTISYNGLVSLYNTLKQESGNVLKGYSDGISQYSNQLSAIYSKGTPAGYGNGTTGASTGAPSGQTTPLTW